MTAGFKMCEAGLCVRRVHTPSVYTLLSSYTPGVTLCCFEFAAGLTLGRCAEWVVQCVV